MKKLLTILAALLIPLSLWAMTPVDESDLANVTGQAGVNINADLTMNINIGTMAWGDSDGVAPNASPQGWSRGYFTGGFVGMNNFNLTGLRINARAESSDNWNGYNTFSLKPITIDVATMDKSAVGGATNQTFVRFGLGSLKIAMNAMSFNVGTGSYAPAGTAVNINQIMGSVNMGAMSMYFNPYSYVDIFSHPGQGVNFEMSITVDRFQMGYISWGDSDGLNGIAHTTADVEWAGTGATAGYIGLSNMNFGTTTTPAFVIAGTAAIDVLTTRSGEYAVLPSAKAAALRNFCWTTFGDDPATHVPDNADYFSFYSWLRYGGGTTTLSSYYSALAANPNDTLSGYAPAGVSPVSIVHISFPGGFSFEMGSMRAQVVLANNANLNTYDATMTGYISPQVMGDLYLQQLSVNISSGSWVDIWAH